MKYLSGQMFLVVSICIMMSASSCTRPGSPIVVPLLSPRLDSPEISDNPTPFVGGISVIYPNRLTMVPDISAVPVVTNDPGLSLNKHVPVLSAHFGLTLLKQIEFSADIKNGVQLKYQLFGARRHNARVGNVSAAVMAGYNYSVGGGEEHISNYSDYGSRSAYYDWRLKSSTASIVFGFRPDENIIIYGGPRFTSYKLSGKLNQDGMGTYHEDSYEYILTGDGYDSGLGFGLEFAFDGGIVQQAIVYTLNIRQIRWDNYQSKSLLNHGLLVKYYF